jgi:hypothetical protein
METRENKGFRLDSVKYTYEIDKSRRMEGFFAKSFMTTVDWELIEATATYPQAFLYELYRSIRARVPGASRAKQRVNVTHFQHLSRRQCRISIQLMGNPHVSLQQTSFWCIRAASRKTTTSDEPDGTDQVSFPPLNKHYTSRIR